MIICQFIFKPGVYDDDFHRLDRQIDAYARSLPGFRATETWQSAEGAVINATYYFDDMASVRQLSQFPQHLEAKGQYQRGPRTRRRAAPTSPAPCTWVRFAQYGDMPTEQAAMAQAGMESYFDSLGAHLGV